MKKIISFFVLIAFIIIGFFQNTIMIFAMEDSQMNTKMALKMTSIDYEENSIIKDPCKKHECCYENNKNFDTKLSNSQRISIEKIKIITKNYTEIFLIPNLVLDTKKQININPPPDIIKENTNYSYKNLIKIIKSNT